MGNRYQVECNYGGPLIMKNFTICLLFLITALIFFSCGKDQGEKGTVIAKINDYSLLQDDFKSQLSFALEVDVEFRLTRETKKEFLEEIIRKELMIQEAKRMNLDRKEKFMQAIERYWEATLIRDLMELKGGEISTKVVVSEEEIIDAYKKKYQQSENAPELEKVRDSILENLKDNKKTMMLKKWITGLREKSDIQINDDVLYSN